MPTFQEARSKVAAAAHQLEHNIIFRSLDPERCTERKRYNNLAEHLIDYFSDFRTRAEFDRIGTSLLLDRPFTMERTRGETGETVTFTRTPESGPENTLPEEGASASAPPTAMQVSYDAGGELASIVYFPHERQPVQIARTKGGWGVTAFSAENIGAIGRTKARYNQERREIFTFWDDLWESVNLNIQSEMEPEEMAREYARFRASRDAEKVERTGYMNRNKFLVMGGLATLAVVLVGCSGPTGGGGQETAKIAPSIEKSSSRPELQELVDAGVYSAPLEEKVLQAEYVPDLSMGAKEALYAYLGSDAAAKTLNDGWRQVTTPAFLKERGILTGSDLAQVFEFKNANGGVRYFDKVSNRYIKLSPADSLDARYLKLAYKDTLSGWKAIGMPEEYIAAVQWSEGFVIDGKPYVMMVTPNVGNNLEGFMNMIRNNKKMGGDAKALSILDEYFTKVLFPMNAAGIIQQDLNFKNITVLTQADGSIRFVPIDLAAHPKILEKEMVFQWQYEQLAERAARRQIAMPSFAEYLQAHPDVADKVRVFEQLNKEGLFKTSVQVGENSVHLYMPKKLVGDNIDKSTVDSIIAEMKRVYGEGYDKMPQGQVFSLEVKLADGSKEPVAFMKTNAIGGKVRPIGGNWGEALGLVKSGLRFASDALMVLWIASEVAEFTDPDYKAVIESGVAFPDTAVSTGKDNGVVLLDAMWDRLNLSKEQLAASAAGMTRWSPVVEEMANMTNKDALTLITEFGVPQPHIIKYVEDKVKQGAVPPAPSEMQFQSPLPVLVPGAKVPTSAYFSAFETEGGEKDMLFWAQVQEESGDGKKTMVTVPVTAFAKPQGAKGWTMIPIINKPWSVQFQLTSLPLTYVCGTASSNGKQFELQCVNQK